MREGRHTGHGRSRITLRSIRATASLKVIAEFAHLQAFRQAARIVGVNLLNFRPNC